MGEYYLSLCDIPSEEAARQVVKTLREHFTLYPGDLEQDPYDVGWENYSTGTHEGDVVVEKLEAAGVSFVLGIRSDYDCNVEHTPTLGTRMVATDNEGAEMPDGDISALLDLTDVDEIHAKIRQYMGVAHTEAFARLTGTRTPVSNLLAFAGEVDADQGNREHDWQEFSAKACATCGAAVTGMYPTDIQDGINSTGPCPGRRD